MVDGLAGFPLVDGIPRGEMFVSYMKGRSATQTSASPASAPAAPTLSAPTAPKGLQAGNFDRNADADTTATDTKDLGDGREQTDFTREYSDGSVLDATRTLQPDGSGTETGVRRSLPDADGFQMVRVSDTTIDADGTRNTDVRTFRVPAGTSMDWSSAEAQTFFVDSETRIIPPGMTWKDVPEQAEKPAPARPVIPLPV